MAKTNRPPTLDPEKREAMVQAIQEKTAKRDAERKAQRDSYDNDPKLRKQKIREGGDGVKNTAHFATGQLGYLGDDYKDVTSVDSYTIDDDTLMAAESHNNAVKKVKKKVQIGSRLTKDGKREPVYKIVEGYIDEDGAFTNRLKTGRRKDGRLGEWLETDKSTLPGSQQITEAQYERALQNKQEDAMMNQMLANGGGEQSFDKARRLERGWEKAKLRGLYGEAPSQAQVEARERWSAKDAFSTYGNRNNAARDAFMYSKSDAFGKAVYGQMSKNANKYLGAAKPAYGTGASMFDSYLKNSEEMHKAEMKRRENETSQNQQLINTLSGLSTALLGQTPPNQTPNANTVRDASKAAGAVTPTQTPTVNPTAVPGLGQGIVQEEQKQ